MWSIFKYKNSNQGQLSKERYEEISERSFQELRAEFYQKFKQVTRQIVHSESLFTHTYLVDVKEESLSNTFDEMMASLQGLMSIIGQLKIEYDQLQNQLEEYRQMKEMITNHTAIIDAIQQTHSRQVAEIYRQKADNERLYLQKIEGVNIERRQFQKKACLLQQQLNRCREQMQGLRSQNERVIRQKKCLQDELLDMTLRYNQVVDEGRQLQLKKVIDFQNIKLDYVFYYGRLRQKVINFLSIKDMLNLQQVSKLYRYTFRRDKSRYIFMNLNRKIKIMQKEQIKNAKYYQKIYEMFPLQNIKVCAFKYLYFKIKPATYILPYLQEQYVQTIKIQNQTKEEKDSITTNRFNWKHFFTSDKSTTKNENRREQSKFNLSQLKNQDQYKRLQNRLQLTFRYIFPIRMPQDLNYFGETMERQLQELKGAMSGYKGRMGQIEWTSQLHCLTRYMYLQIGQIYNLLQVVFGDLVAKNRQLIGVRESYEYLRENEMVLRNLIENISNDKSNIQKKYLLMENEMVKLRLEKEVMANKYDILLGEYEKMKKEYSVMNEQYVTFMKVMEKWQEERREAEMNMNMVREQLQNLQNYGMKQRRGSFASMGSQEPGVQRESISS